MKFMWRTAKSQNQLNILSELKKKIKKMKK